MAGINVFSSYDLEDQADGASLHLAEILGDVALSVPVIKIVMKKRGLQAGIAGVINRTSFTYACAHALRAVTRPHRSGTWLLLGMHALLLAPFCERIAYVPLDCWSARERALAAKAHGPRKVLRAIYAGFVSLCEATLIRHCAIIAVISPEEAAKFNLLYPDLEARVMILPLRNFQISDDAPPAPKQLATGAPVAVWMDARPDYGRESILASLDHLARLAEEDPTFNFDVTVLSRSPDLVLEPGQKARNLPYVEDIESFLGRQALVILPDLFGTGVKNRAVQVAALGVPLLTTPIALEGLDWAPLDKNVLVYTGFSDFRHAIKSAVTGEAARRAKRLFKHIVASDITNRERRSQFAQRIAKLALGDREMATQFATKE